jgi:acetylornithine deacetylase/succinyl-diaminopimelate desuccinylase-like protein
VPFLFNDTTREFFRLMATVSSPEDAARYRAVLGNDAAAAAAAHDYLQKNEPRYASMLHTSISPTIINGGYRSNVIPSEAKATLDVRMMREEDPATFLEAVQRVINNPAVTARYTAATTRPVPPPAHLDAEAFKVIQSAVARNYDAATIPMMGTAATDMAQVRGKGAQCFGIGPAADLEDPAKGFGAHSDQERILEAELYRFVRFTYEIVYDLARRAN